MKVKLVQIMPLLGCAIMLQGMTAVAQDNNPRVHSIDGYRLFQWYLWR